MTLAEGLSRRLHTPNPQSDPDPPTPGREVPDPPVPPDMDPVVPVQEPPGRGTDGEPPPVIASS